MKPSLRWERYKTTKNTFLPIIQQLEKSGKKILDLTSGDPVIHGFPNESINKYLIKAIKDGWNMYANSSPWLNKVKETIVDYEKRTRSSTYIPDNILITPGTASALFVLHYSLLDAGDEVIALDPSHYLGAPTSYWSCFRANVIPCPTKQEHEWIADPDELTSKITKKTKAIFINNPNNPTGAVYDEKLLKKVVNIAGEHDLLLISDEIYGLIVFDEKKVTSLGAIANDVPSVILNGISKVFMRTGWRFGYMCIHDPDDKVPELIKAMKYAATAYGHATRGVATPILAAATMMFKDAPFESSRKFVIELQKRRDYIMRRIDEIEGLSCVRPNGALYAFPQVELIPSVWKSDEEFLIDLLKEEQVLFSSGSSYGKQGFGHFRTLLMPEIKIQEEIYNRLERLIKNHISLN